MLQVKVLVGECLSAIYTGGAGAIAVEEITALAHEIWNLGGEQWEEQSEGGEQQRDPASP